MANLAILILAKNEHDNIVDVVENAARCADEVIVIDSGSTDDTVALAEAYGARVVYRAWTGDFAAQRNFALAQTEAPWVLYLDADERLNEDLLQKVRAVVTSDMRDTQYEMERRSVAFGQMFRHGVLKPDHVARLFPREKVRWVGNVHEHAESPLQCRRLSGYLEHHTYRSFEQWEKKLCQYTTLWADDAFARGRRISKAGILAHSFGGLFKMLVLRLGFLDGWLGVYMCLNHFFYEMLKYLKLYEREKRKGSACE